MDFQLWYLYVVVAIAFILYWIKLHYGKEYPALFFRPEEGLSGGPTFLFGEPPHQERVGVKEVKKTKMFGWIGHGRKLIITLEKPIALMQSYIPGMQTSTKFVIDDRMIVGRDKDGNVVTSIEEKYNKSSTVLRMYKDSFGADLATREVGEMKKMIKELDDLKLDHIKLTTELASARKMDDYDKAKKLLTELRDLESAYKGRREEYYDYTKRSSQDWRQRPHEGRYTGFFEKRGGRDEGETPTD